MEEIKDGIVKVLSEVLNIPPENVAATDKFVDLENWDSLFHLNVILGIEKKFGVHFDIQEVMLINSIPEAVNLVIKKTH